MKFIKEEEEKTMNVERKGKPSSFLYKAPPDYILPEFNKHPPTFLQTVVQTDGSTFTMKVCTPRPFLTLSKDTRNHPLWNPELTVSYDDTAAQVTKFAEKYGHVNVDAFTSVGGATGDSSGKKADGAATSDLKVDVSDDAAADTTSDMSGEFGFGIALEGTPAKKEVPAVKAAEVAPKKKKKK